MMIIFRYWAITDPINYPAKMTSKKVGRYIAGVWFCSSLISFPAIVWWRATQEGPALKTQCLFTEDIGYRIFSSIISFYAPACFMLFAYYKIYKEAKRHTKSLVNGRMILKEGKSQPLGKILSFLEDPRTFEGRGRTRGLRRFRKAHLENILPRGSRDRDPRSAVFWEILK